MSSFLKDLSSRQDFGLQMMVILVLHFREVQIVNLSISLFRNYMLYIRMYVHKDHFSTFHSPLLSRYPILKLHSIEPVIVVGLFMTTLGVPHRNINASRF